MKLRVLNVLHMFYSFCGHVLHVFFTIQRFNKRKDRAIDKIAKEAAIKYAASCCLFSCIVLSASSPIPGGFPFSLIPGIRRCRIDARARDHDQTHILW